MMLQVPVVKKKIYDISRCYKEQLLENSLFGKQMTRDSVAIFHVNKKIEDEGLAMQSLKAQSERGFPGFEPEIQQALIHE